jgi:uncharacterized protein YbjT (DUF2867 family)
MADKKIIAVLGATGSQGGSLVRAILSDPNGGFAARAITRDVNCQIAFNCDPVFASNNDPLSIAFDRPRRDPRAQRSRQA